MRYVIVVCAIYALWKGFHGEPLYFVAGVVIVAILGINLILEELHEIRTRINGIHRNTKPHQPHEP